MNLRLFSQLLGNLALFVFAVTILWLVYRGIKHAADTHWSFKYWVEDLASVNTRMSIALGLFTLTILVLLGAVVINAGGVFRADLDHETIRLILLAEFGAMGWDVIGFIGKRVTYKPGAPDSQPDAPAPVPDATVPPVQPLVSKPVVTTASANQQSFTPRPAFTPESD